MTSLKDIARAAGAGDVKTPTYVYRDRVVKAAQRWYDAEQSGNSDDISRERVALICAVEILERAES